MRLQEWTYLAGVFCLVACYDNLSRRRTTTVTQSTTFKSDTDFWYNATLAIDGLTNTSDSYCSHTGTDQAIAWLQVDLGAYYSIHSVKLFYRNEEGIWRPYRFRQFFLDVSGVPVTESITLNRTRCFTDNTSAPEVPPDVISIPCQHTARYVIVETTYDAPEDDPVKGPILEICEIEINGCEIGKYGDDCISCQGCQTCNIESGKCVCNNTHYGPTCSNECSDKCTMKSCSDETGFCVFGCRSGYYGNRCNIACYACQSGCDRITGECIGDCPVGMYGFSCDRNCNNYCRNGCEKISGLCNECVSGKMGNFCNTTCGDDCGYGCDRTTGNCTERPEWYDDRPPDTEVRYNSFPNSLFILYIVVAFLFMSLIINVFTVTWIVCPNRFKRRQKSNKGCGDSSINSTSIIRQSTVYETADDNTGYHELAYISGSSHYDEFQGDYLDPCSM